MLPPHQNYSVAGRKSQSERIKIRLYCNLAQVIVFVFSFFSEHIIHKIKTTYTTCSDSKMLLPHCGEGASC